MLHKKISLLILGSIIQIVISDEEKKQEVSETDVLTTLNIDTAVRIYEFRTVFFDMIRSHFTETRIALRRGDQWINIPISAEHWFRTITSERLQEDLRHILDHDRENDLMFIRRINVNDNGQVCLVFRNVPKG